MSKKTNPREKTILIAACAVIAILVAGSLLATLRPKKTILAFYNVPEKTVSVLQDMLGSSFSYELWNSDRPLSWELEQRKNPDVLVTPSGKALKDAQAAASPKILLGTDILKDTTTSIKALAAVSKERGPLSIPLLTSHLEIAVQTQELKKTGIKTINSWNDIERFARAAREKTGSQILFAGKDSGAFLDILGAMGESFGGKQSYENAVQLVEIAMDKVNKKTEFDAGHLAASLAASPDTPFYDAVRTLNRWYKEGLLFAEVFSLDQKSLASLMEHRAASLVFQTLEEHRAGKQNVIEKYTSIYFPSNMPAYSRAFTAPVYLATPLKNKKEALASLERLLESSKQEQLSRATGLAPVLARCRTPDKEADDVRYWVAATSSPLAGFSRELSLAHSQQELLAAELAALVRFGSF